MMLVDRFEMEPVRGLGVVDMDELLDDFFDPKSLDDLEDSDWEAMFGMCDDMADPF